ncbi:hypothetical protein SDC9_139525 [bioreactor metagenome]|uniref:Serine aminopeptidase S33 domain-containing protein n=1 Tax=bioreactor metagenome TaxID=1076179 RepID=A0A645DSC5_9ZZZZ
MKAKHIIAAATAATAAGGVYLFNYAMKRPKEIPNPREVEKLKPHWDPYLDRIRQEKEWFFAQDIKEVEIKSHDGLRLFATLLEAENPTDKTVLAIHGYKCCGINEFCCYVRFYHNLGFNVLLPDNRAHGKSEGKYIGFGYLDRLDCIAWTNFLVEKYGENSKILLHGISMGAATVMSAAGEENLPVQVVGAIEDCGFSSGWEQLGRSMKDSFKLPQFPLLYSASLISKAVAKYDFKECSAEKALTKAKIPFVFIHGSEDDFVPTDMVYKVYNACASEDKEVYIFDGAKHAMSYFVDTPRYEKIVTELAEKIGMLDK